MRVALARKLVRTIGACLPLVLVTAVRGNSPVGLAAADRELIKSVLEKYRTAWLANDADAVRATFTKDAVLMPHHGLNPIVGLAAMNEFWWPATTARTTVLKFVRTIDEVGGNASLAYVRGRSEVAWKMEDGGKTESWRTAGNYMAVLKRQTDGKWLISHLIWDDVPNQRIE